jgi:hypothetical protein
MSEDQNTEGPDLFKTNLGLCFVRCTFAKASFFTFINVLVPTSLD